MNYGSSTSSWKPWKWVRLDLILTMRDIYIHSNLNALTKFISSSRSTKIKDILPQIISQIIMNTVTISMRIVISYAMKWGIPLCIWWKVYGNWDNNIIKIFQWRESQSQLPSLVSLPSGSTVQAEVRSEKAKKTISINRYHQRSSLFVNQSQLI